MFLCTFGSGWVGCATFTLFYAYSRIIGTLEKPPKISIEINTCVNNRNDTNFTFHSKYSFQAKIFLNTPKRCNRKAFALLSGDHEFECRCCHSHPLTGVKGAQLTMLSLWEGWHYFFSAVYHRKASQL